MKKKLTSTIIILLIIFIIFNIFYNSKDINSVISFSISIFIKNIFPSLFPMFVISDVLVELGIPIFLGNLFSKITTKLFNVKKEASFVFFMSLISGFPSNAKYIKTLVNKKIFDHNDANKVLMFTSFSNPLFIFNTVGILFFNNIKIGLYIFLASLLGNITVGFLFKNLYIKKEIFTKIDFKDNLKLLNNNINNTKIFKTFLKSVNSSLQTLLNIFGIITCFLIFTTIINNFANFNYLTNLIITGIMEFTSGLNLVSISNISFNLKLYISMFFIAFGGLSVHAQIVTILEDIKINYGLFLLSRIIHSLLSIIYLYIFINL